MNRWNLAWLIGIPMVVVMGLTLSYSAPIGREHDQDYELIHLIGDVLTEVDHNYVRELTPDERRRLVEDMINGGLERLDPHSSYFSEREFRQFEGKTKGKFGGIGVQISLDRSAGALMVTSPIVGTPAYDAGLMSGDLIIKINGESMEHKRTAEAVELIQGDPGEKVTLTVLHEGDPKPVEITLTRAEIEVPTVLGNHRKTENPSEWDYVVDRDNKIAHVRLLEFHETTPAELKTVIQGLEAEGVRGVVLDLRGNPGGLLPSAVEIADFFLTEGTIVSTRERNTKQEKPYVAKAAGGLLEPAKDHPMVVLVDRFSASASEIVSAALQDHQRAVVAGERSFGKGSVQKLIRLGDRKSAIKLTTASYWRPSGKNIHRFPDSKDTDEWGVKPNEGFDVSLTDEERKAYYTGRRARDILPSKTGVMPDKLREKVEGPFTDKVLDKAVEYLRDQVKKS